METGEKRTILEDALAVAWDGDDAIVTTDRFSRASLARVARDGSSIAAMADDAYLYSAAAPGPHGVYAVRSTHRDLFDHEAALVRVDDDVVEVLYDEDGVRAMDPVPGPDGTLAFVHDAAGFDEVALLRDGDPETLYAVDGAEVAEPAWHADWSELAVTVTRDAVAHVHVVDVTTGEGYPVTDGKRFHTAPAWLEGDVLATVDGPRFPGQVRTLETNERVTPSTVAGLRDRLVEPETLTYRSGSEEIQAVVYPPAADADPESVPLLVKAHGGPTSFDRFRFDWRAGYLAALGYAVVCPNYRGSDGYGRAFRMANDRAWGAGDLDDVVRAADALADEYEAVDGSRAGIYGGSGGGLMTVNAVARTDRFDAGAAFYGVYDYESFVDDTDDVGWQLMKRELGDPATDLENYRDASPIRHVPDIEAPLLVLHGEADERVPISQSEQLVAQLEAHGKLRVSPVRGRATRLRQPGARSRCVHPRRGPIREVPPCRSRRRVEPAVPRRRRDVGQSAGLGPASSAGVARTGGARRWSATPQTRNVAPSPATATNGPAASATAPLVDMNGALANPYAIETAESTRGATDGLDAVLRNWAAMGRRIDWPPRSRKNIRTESTGAASGAGGTRRRRTGRRGTHAGCRVVF